MKFGKLIGLIAVVGMLGACGYKADLYLAKDHPTAKPGTSEPNSDEEKQKESKPDGTRD